jgi:hypothetical protein
MKIGRKGVVQPRFRVLLATFVCVAFTTSAASLRAWEEDVHYVLTFWLATQAGFSRDDADQIAQGDQSYDDSEHRSAIPTVLWIVLTNDTGAARELQLKHFPSDALLPSPPARRAVAPNNPAARKALEAALAAGESATALIAFGEAFHPFQDSWSHQGVPDIPYNLKPNLISAHPQARGGWKSHNADLTALHVEETLDMARQTYLLLDRFLSQNTRFRRQPAAPWATLEPIVRAFATARTPAEKAAWASRHVPEQRAQQVLHAVAPGSRARMRVLSPPLFNSTGSSTQQLSVADQASLLGAINGFMGVWLGQTDVDAALKYVDPAGLIEQLAGDGGLTTAAAVQDWAGKFLTIQLIDDHSAVNDAGHGDPLHPRYSELPRRPQPTGPFKATRKVDFPRLGARDVLATDLVAGGFAVVLDNEDLTHDALTVVWRRVSDRWLVTRLLVIPR